MDKGWANFIKLQQLDSTMQQHKPKTVFIVEHMEPYLFEWCFYEYQAMSNYLEAFEAQLWITNAQVIFDYQGEQKQDNLKYLQELQKCFARNSQKFRLVPESVQALLGKIQGRVCMLDMRGKQQLAPEEHWDYIVFGGILGDHPPRDRPAPIRQYFQEVRHLGSLQLATDTAVLVSRLILFNSLKLNSIPMIQEPTVRGFNKEGLRTTVQMEGFSYISKELEIDTGKLRQGLSKKQKKQVYMSEGVRNLLLKQDLDANFLM